MTEYEKLKKEIAAVSSDTQLIAVSKLQPLEKIQTLFEKGHRNFGENYVQEFLEKYELLKDKKILWHFIGHLQSNKVKYLIGKVHLIHSVDSLKLAKEIDKQSQKNSVIQNILLQVNVAQEDTKSGFSVEELKQSWKELTQLPNLKILGLMTMPPLQNEAEENRSHFKKLKNLLLELNSSELLGHNMKELSMGTSSDYIVAAEEGATYVRIGTLVFGERPSK